LIFSAGKAPARVARSATTEGSSRPRVKSVGGMVVERPRRQWTGRPATLPARSCRAVSMAHFAPPFHRIAAWSRPLADRTPSAVGSKPSIEARRNGKIAAMVSTVSP